MCPFREKKKRWHNHQSRDITTNQLPPINHLQSSHVTSLYTIYQPISVYQWPPTNRSCRDRKYGLAFIIPHHSHFFRFFSEFSFKWANILRIFSLRHLTADHKRIFALIDFSKFCIFFLFDFDVKNCFPTFCIFRYFLQSQGVRHFQEIVHPRHTWAPNFIS